MLSVKLTRKYVVLAEVARHLKAEQKKNRFKGIAFWELMGYLQSVRASLGFIGRESILAGHLLVSMTIGPDAEFVVSDDIVYFKGDVRVTLQRRRRNRRRA